MFTRAFVEKRYVNLCSKVAVYPMEEEEVEEGREPKIRRGPAGPTRDERARHEATHLPYRSWCAECVAGKGRDHHHQAVREAEDERAVQEVHLDYCFPRDHEGGERRTVLVVKARRSRAIFGHVVPMKGADVGWASSQVQRDLVKLGIHGKVTLKSDQELALVDLLNHVASERKGETLLEAAPRGDSAGNGLIERAVQALEGQMRVLKGALEKKVGERLSVAHPMFPWLVEHAGDVLTKFLVGEDGRTAYERTKGKKCSGEMYQFGASIMHRTSGKVTGGVMADRWHEGVWLGKRFGTGEHIVTMDGKVDIELGA